MSSLSFSSQEMTNFMNYLRDSNHSKPDLGNDIDNEFNKLEQFLSADRKHVIDAYDQTDYGKQNYVANTDTTTNIWNLASHLDSTFQFNNNISNLPSNWIKQWNSQGKNTFETANAPPQDTGTGKGDNSGSSTMSAAATANAINTKTTNNGDGIQLQNGMTLNDIADTLIHNWNCNTEVKPQLEKALANSLGLSSDAVNNLINNPNAPINTTGTISAYVFWQNFRPGGPFGGVAYNKDYTAPDSSEIPNLKLPGMGSDYSGTNFDPSGSNNSSDEQTKEPGAPAADNAKTLNNFFYGTDDGKQNGYLSLHKIDLDDSKKTKLNDLIKILSDQMASDKNFTKGDAEALIEKYIDPKVDGYDSTNNIDNASAQDFISKVEPDYYKSQGADKAKDDHTWLDSQSGTAAYDAVMNDDAKKKLMDDFIANKLAPMQGSGQVEDKTAQQAMNDYMDALYANDDTAVNHPDDWWAAEQKTLSIKPTGTDSASPTHGLSAKDWEKLKTQADSLGGPNTKIEIADEADLSGAKNVRITRATMNDVPHYYVMYEDGSNQTHIAPALDYDDSNAPTHDQVGKPIKWTDSYYQNGGAGSDTRGDTVFVDPATGNHLHMDSGSGTLFSNGWNAFGNDESANSTSAKPTDHNLQNWETIYKALLVTENRIHNNNEQNGDAIYEVDIPATKDQPAYTKKIKKDDIEALLGKVFSGLKVAGVDMDQLGEDPGYGITGKYTAGWNGKWFSGSSSLPQPNEREGKLAWDNFGQTLNS